MKEIRDNLELICKAFDLGRLIGWVSTDDVAGFKAVTFNTEKEENLTYYFK